MQSLQPLDYAAMGIYMSLMAGLGITLGFFVKNIADYFRGGSAIPWYAGAISNFMSLFSTFVFVAHAGIAYEHGLVALVIMWCTVPAALIGALVFAKRWRRAGIMSPVEFMEVRFNLQVRQVFSWGGVGFRILDNMVRLYAIGLFVSTATPLSLEAAILLGGLVVVLYTVVGGLWAVILTDVVQFVVLIAAVLILVPLAVEAAGGWEALVAASPGHVTFFQGPKGEAGFLIAYYLMFVLKSNGNWTFIQRFYSVRDERAGMKMGLMTAGLFLVFPIFFLIPAIAAYTLIPGLENPEMAYVSVALQLLPPGIMGLMLAAMFAATMSSLDSEFNVMSSVLTRDVYQRLLRPAAPERELMWIARLGTLLVGGLVILGAFSVDRFGGAFEASKLFTGIFAVPLIVPVLLGVLLKRPQTTGALFSLVLGIGSGLALNMMPDISWPVATLLTLLVCVGTFWLSAAWPVKDPLQVQRIGHFFEQLKTPVAEAEKATISPAFKRSLIFMFVIALGAAGVLFAGMGASSLSLYSGKLALAAGLGCLAIAGGLLFFLPVKALLSPQTET
jgi:solute:Na+ symporter, SSS family